MSKRTHFLRPNTGWRTICGTGNNTPYGVDLPHTTGNHRRVDCERCLKILINMGLEAEGIRRKLEHERAKR